MKIRNRTLLIMFVLMFILGIIAQNVLFEGELPVDFPILFASALFFLLASYNRTAAKVRKYFSVIIIIVGIFAFLLFLQSRGILA